MQQCWLVDASIYIFRSYFSLPPRWRHQDNGYETHAVYGFTRFLIGLLAEKPAAIYCAFDESLGSGLRHQVYPQYKANRELPDEALAFQLQSCREVCRLLGVAEGASDLYEADDLIGSAAALVRQRTLQPVIVSRDKDLAQLIGPDDLFWDYPNDPVGDKELAEKFSVRCDQLADYLALLGDSSDNIPGVPGVGPKTAAALLAVYPTLEDIFENLPQVAELAVRGASKLPDKLAEYREQIYLARELATIVTDMEKIPGLGEIAPGPIDHKAFAGFCSEMGFPAAVARQAATLL